MRFVCFSYLFCNTQHFVYFVFTQFCKIAILRNLMGCKLRIKVSKDIKIEIFSMIFSHFVLIIFFIFLFFFTLPLVTQGLASFFFCFQKSENTLIFGLWALQNKKKAKTKRKQTQRKFVLCDGSMFSHTF